MSDNTARYHKAKFTIVGGGRGRGKESVTVTALGSWLNELEHGDGWKKEAGETMAVEIIWHKDANKNIVRRGPQLGGNRQTIKRAAKTSTPRTSSTHGRTSKGAKAMSKADATVLRQTIERQGLPPNVFSLDLTAIGPDDPAYHRLARGSTTQGTPVRCQLKQGAGTQTSLPFKPDEPPEYWTVKQAHDKLNIFGSINNFRVLMKDKATLYVRATKIGEVCGYETFSSLGGNTARPIYVRSVLDGRETVIPSAKDAQEKLGYSVAKLIGDTIETLITEHDEDLDLDTIIASASKEALDRYKYQEPAKGDIWRVVRLSEPIDWSKTGFNDRDWREGGDEDEEGDTGVDDGSEVY